MTVFMLKLIMKIGNILCQNNLILAPMASVTDIALKQLSIEFGADFAVSEMVSAKGLKYGSKNTYDLLRTADNESIKVVQLFGHEPEVFAEVVKLPALDKFDIIDINMGCPAPKIIKNGDGSKLMENIPLARNIIKACVENTSKPVTVKFRAGYQNVNCIEFAKMCEDAGASAITIHPRLREEFYSGKANYNLIKQIKSEVSIPVIGSGDVVDMQSYHDMLATGVDAVMIGRGALGNPEIFSELLGKDTNVAKLDLIKRHYDILLNIYSENFVVKHMRKHVLWYLKGCKNASEYKKKVVEFDSVKEVIDYLEKNKECIWEK